MTAAFLFVFVKITYLIIEKYIAHLVERPAIREAEGSNPSMLFVFRNFYKPYNER